MSGCTSFNTKSLFLPTALAVLLATSGGTALRAADAVTPGELVLERPTLICLGFQWFVDGDDNRNATVKVEFRAKSTPSVRIPPGSGWGWAPDQMAGVQISSCT